MRRTLACAAIVVLGLWLGGLVTLVIFVASLFTHDHTLASSAAPWLFHVFERYQLGLAAVALVLLMTWRAFGRPWQRTASLASATIATLLAIFEIAYVTPNVLKAQGIDPATFEFYHHLATTNYTITTIFVMIALVFAVLSICRVESIVV